MNETIFVIVQRLEALNLKLSVIDFKVDNFKS